jgi:hypothetical protein
MLLLILQSVEMLVGSLSTAAVVDQKSGWGLVLCTWLLATAIERYFV